MVISSGFALLTFGALLTVLLLSSGIFFHREGSLLGSMIYIPGGVVSFTLLFEALTFLTFNQPEALLWSSGWFLGFLLYLPSMLIYVVSITEQNTPSAFKKLLTLADALVLVLGIAGFVNMVNISAGPSAASSFTENPSGFLPAVSTGFLWFFGYFLIRLVMQLKKVGKILFFKVKVKSADWRRVIWFPLTILFIIFPLIDILPMLGYRMAPLGQLSFPLLFISLYVGVRFRFLYRVSARFAAEEILQTMPEPLMVCDTKGHIQIVNNAFCSVFNYEREEVLGHNLFFTSNRENRKVVLEVVQREQTDGLERILYDRNGMAIQSNLSVSRLRDRDGALTGIIVAVKDIRNYRSAMDRLEELFRTTEAVVQERTRELHHAAYHDGLTGLPNREMFTERLQQVFSKFIHRKGKPFALLFIDLDRFKMINDSLGHLAGDFVLKETAARLGICLRDVDTIGRLGGDEFVVLLEDIDGSHDVVTAAERIVESMNIPFSVETEERIQEVHTSASIGICIVDKHYVRAEEMLRDADFALYRAKEAGKNRYALFNETVQENVLEIMKVERELRVAIRQEQLSVWYQPIINLENRRLSGLEALARWNHPERGLLPPSDFIPIAEESDLIVEIDRWVLKQACMDLAAWHRDLSADGEDSLPTVSVNVSARHLADTRLILDIRNALEESALNPASLIVEITESAIISNLNVARKILEEVKELGVGLHLDDFGEGYSSVNLLNTVPFDAMKIDRAYVTGIRNEQSGSRLLKTIVDLGHSMEKLVIAEGIEHSDEADLLKGFNCEHGQGFLFSKPLSRDDIAVLISDYSLAADTSTAT